VVVGQRIGGRPVVAGGGQPVVTYSVTPGMPEEFGTWCAAAWTVVWPVTPGGMTSALAPPPLLRPATYQTTPPMITAATAAMAAMVIRLRRRSALLLGAHRRDLLAAGGLLALLCVRHRAPVISAMSPGQMGYGRQAGERGEARAVLSLAGARAKDLPLGAIRPY
jgi:hypothetical protein